MLTIVAPLIVFGLVIFVHELGHFIAAKLTGVYAPRFSVGFGPALLSKRFGETEYRLAIIPLGGYVRMASREDEATAFLEGGSEVGVESAKEAENPVEVHTEYHDPNAMKPFGPKDVPENRWFESKSLPARLFIMLSGVTMNVILAFVLCVGILVYYGKPKPSPAVDQVVSGKPAAAAGLKPGDSLISIGGTSIKQWEDFQRTVEGSIGVPLSLTLMRDGKPMTVTVTPAADTMTDTLTGKPKPVGRIGLLAKSLRDPIPFGEALGGGLTMIGEMGGLVFHTLRNIHPSQLGGPIAIAQASVQVAKSGWVSLLLLIATISVNIAIVNLLPIPVLDGGQIVINILESIKGKPFSLRTRENILRGGLIVIAAIFVLVMFNDISRNIEPITRFFARLFGRGA
jgi:regulator of sigma E protease